MKRPVVPAAALACTALLLSACGGSGSGSSPGPRVIASFYPLEYVVAQVGGDHLDVEDLTTPGAEPHDIELTARQVGAVGEADLVVYESGFQAAVDQAVDQATDLSESARVDVSDLVELLPLDADGHHDDPAGDDDHDHGALDPHVWLAPTNMVTIADAVVDQLSVLDPDHAADYRRNGRALRKDLDALDEDFRTGLAHCERREFVTSHAAFGYLADAYDLEQVPIAGIEPSNEPSGSQLADIATEVEQDGITTVFTEEIASPKVAETIAAETGATTAVLDPIEGLTDATEDETYLTLMRRNLTALQEANGCS